MVRGGRKGWMSWGKRSQIVCGCFGGGRVKAKEVLEWVGGQGGGLMGVWVGGWGAVLTLVLNGAFVLVCVYMLKEAWCLLFPPDYTGNHVASVYSQDLLFPGHSL